MKYNHEFIDWDQHLIKISVKKMVQKMEWFPFLPMGYQKTGPNSFLVTEGNIFKGFTAASSNSLVSLHLYAVFCISP